MKLYLNVIGIVHVTLGFLYVLLLLEKLRRWLLQVLLRWLNVCSRSHSQNKGKHINKHAYKS